MENIITSILEIEQNAKERLEEAEKKRNQIIADAKAEEENLIKAKIKEAEEKIGQIDSEEKKKTDEKLAEIENSRLEEIKRIDDIYNERHEKWENDIFNAIITGSV